MSDREDIVLEARHIAKAFPGVLALEDAHLTLRRGRLMALLGENGAGKSTLMSILAGAQPPDSGMLRVEGREVRFTHPGEARDAGIAMIHQELSLVPHLTVAENIFLGREPLTRCRLVDRAAMRRRAAELLKQLDLQASPDAPVETLRVGEQQGVEIARALSGQARVIIMDEPTSALSKHEIEVLQELILDLKRRGVALVYITHKLEELDRIADDATVMRDGRVAGEASFKDLTREQIVRWMVGRDLSAWHARTPAPLGDEALRVTGISLRHPERPGDWLLRDISFTVRRGEVLGIFGLMGAGRTELLEVLFGLHPAAASGEICLGGRKVHITSPAAAIAHGLALAPEDRKREGLVLEMSVGENTSLASMRQVTRFGWIRNRAERRHVQRFLERFRVKTPSLEQRIGHLSGGNQQKVILGKWLATRPQVLLLDEPTRGIDVNAKRELYELLDELTAEGLAVVLVSSELPEILAMADRLVVLCEGRKTAELCRADATSEQVMQVALPQGKEAA
ncbi:MAG TPA: sugar ABC transporter ATP-binding protein [Candidatus Paceibacterota bacterium]|nr:sugar ABC transporter ATP-binding protein [Candidatus Paceibacterota bacterium]